MEQPAGKPFPLDNLFQERSNTPMQFQAFKVDPIV
jgi:hypothetical protein